MKRRRVLGILGGTAVAASLGAVGSRADRTEPEMPSDARMPVVFLPHGGGPWPFVDLPMFDEQDVTALANYLTGLPAAVGRAKALLVISAHWEEPVPTVMAAERPPMLYDYYGFPPESYAITWPAPGAPELAARVRTLLTAGGFETAADATRGFDHGTFVPLKLMYPQADVPTIQLSLVRGLDPAEHLAMGRALAPLRDEGVLILGSGMSYHNLKRFMAQEGRSDSETFDAWLRAAAIAAPPARAESLLSWSSAPAARLAHPREEHLLPLMVVAGAAGDDPGHVGFSELFGGARISAFHYGAGA